MFEALTYDEQLARLTDAAQKALADYGMAGARVTPLMYVNNAVFLVEAGSERYSLRLVRRGQRSEAALRSEMVWLDALNRETGLCLPRPLRPQHGAWLAQARVEGMSEPLWCALFGWVEGESVTPAAMTPAQVEQAGAFLAALHEHSQGFRAPPGFERPRLDWEGLFGSDSPYNPGTGASLFTAEHHAVFEAVGQQARVVMEALGQDSTRFGLIHADFIAKNLLFAEETLCALDFDNCAYGYYLYDLAPLLLQLSADPRYPALKDALWRGYTRTRPLPEGDRAAVETFVAARHVASCRWIAGNLDNPAIRERAPQIIAERVEELRQFLRSGRLERRSGMF